MSVCVAMHRVSCSLFVVRCSSSDRGDIRSNEHINARKSNEFDQKNLEMVARRLLEQSWTRLRTKFNIHELFSIARLEIALR